jgi:hypothetical protein
MIPWSPQAYIVLLIWLLVAAVLTAFWRDVGSSLAHSNNDLYGSPLGEKDVKIQQFMALAFGAISLLAVGVLLITALLSTLDFTWLIPILFLWLIVCTVAGWAAWRLR